jgi:hypothetical protein
MAPALVSFLSVIAFSKAFFDIPIGDSQEVLDAFLEEQGVAFDGQMGQDSLSASILGQYAEAVGVMNALSGSLEVVSLAAVE